MEVLPLTGGTAPPTSRSSSSGCEPAACVCLVADRDLSHTGIEVDFFGETARLPAGPAMLAATTGAALLPVGLWFTDDGWGQSIGSPIELPPTGDSRDRVRAATQALADRFAERDRRPSDRLAHAAEALARRSRRPRPERLSPMRIGIVCPYSWDIPGGVQAHVRDLAETLIALGHHGLGPRPRR